MRSVRRLYFYLVALISAEVVVWGAISLLRTLIATPGLGADNLLAGGLAAVLVGLPIFGIHWTVAQRDAQRDPDERASTERALFFYGLRLALLIPIAQSVMALVNRFFLDIVFQSEFSNRFLGQNQTIADHLASILINALALAYFEYQLRKDHREAPAQRRVEVRRLWRYIWLVYTLALTVLGAHQLMRFLFENTAGVGFGDAGRVAAGLALMLAGAPLWARIWGRIQGSLAEPEERRSPLRLAVLYGLALVGLLVSLFAAGIALTALLRAALGEPLEVFQRYSNAWAAILPFGIVSAYYFRALRQQIQSEPQARQARLWRAWRLVLSLVGTLVVFGGAEALLSAVVDLTIGCGTLLSSVRGRLASGLAALAIGLPLWLRNWPLLQAEARALTETGSEARRSALRKAYLYLLIFLAVVGLMSAGGSLLFRLINAALGSAAPGLAPIAVQRVQLLVLLGVWLVYHLSVLRADGTAAERSLAARHALFPVLVLQQEGDGLGPEVEQALSRLAPGMPVARHDVAAGAPGEELSTASAVVLPSALALQPPDSLRLWLANYSGQLVVVPQAGDRLHWSAPVPATADEAARATAELVRAMAEGHRYAPRPPSSPWVLAGYILAGLFALQLLVIFGFALRGLVAN